MKIAIVGSGYVGLVAAAGFTELGHHVMCVDDDPNKLRALRAGQAPIYERFLPELLQRHSGECLFFADSLAAAIRYAEAIFITVGTPANGKGSSDLTSIRKVAADLAVAVRGLSGHRTIVLKSTVPVGTGDELKRWLADAGIAPERFDVVSNPEFLREGTAVTDFLYPERIVIGAENANPARVLRDIYAPLLEGSYRRQRDAIPAPDDYAGAPRFIETSLRSAELLKHAANAFLAMKISFINAIATLCERVGADVNEVRDGIGADSRIGRKFLDAGIGFGGSCFPKDLSALKTLAEEYGVDLDLLAEVLVINAAQRAAFIARVRTALGDLRGKRLAVLGLAYKGGTDDIRESPALHIVQALLAEGSTITAYDPAAMPNVKAQGADFRLSFVEDPSAAATGADALLILTDWDEFAELDLAELRFRMRQPLIIDGRNLFDPQQMARAGFRYLSIGRADVEPHPLVAIASDSLLKAS